MGCGGGGGLGSVLVHVTLVFVKACFCIIAFHIFANFIRWFSSHRDVWTVFHSVICLSSYLWLWDKSVCPLRHNKLWNTSAYVWNASVKRTPESSLNRTATRPWFPQLSFREYIQAPRKPLHFNYYLQREYEKGKCSHEEKKKKKKKVCQLFMWSEQVFNHLMSLDESFQAQLQFYNHESNFLNLLFGQRS